LKLSDALLKSLPSKKGEKAMISHQVYYLAGASGFDDEILS
jgi:hypothetical protein